MDTAPLSDRQKSLKEPLTGDPDNPLRSLEEWDEFLVERYPEQAAGPHPPPRTGSLPHPPPSPKRRGSQPHLPPSPKRRGSQPHPPPSPKRRGSQSIPSGAGKAAEEYRNYDRPERDSVREFYRLNHRSQTLAFVLEKKREWLKFDKQTMTPWQALEYLNTLVDDSDPDTSLSQIDHIFQTAEAIRADGHPDWFVLTGLMHDVGKTLCLFGEPQWAVVGDTFPVGCRFSDKIVYPEFFADNPDMGVPEYQTQLGIYSEGSGLDSVHLSWSHDEYLYQMLKEYLPLPALYMIRYHSFYPWHKEGEYQFLTNAEDQKMLRWVQLFNPYDLYSKCPTPPDVRELRPYYEDLMAKYLPASLQF